MSRKNFFHWRPSLANDGSVPSSGPTANGLQLKDTSASGSPTALYVKGEHHGGIELDFSSTNEAQVLTIYQGDTLAFDIDSITEFHARLKLKQATPDAATSLAIGLASAQADAIDSVTEAALFRIIGDNSIVVETDDGTINNDDVATGKTLADSYVDFLISFATGKQDVRFFVDGQPVAQATTFDMSNYAGGLQFFLQHQKSADTNTDGVQLVDCGVRGRS